MRSEGFSVDRARVVDTFRAYTAAYDMSDPKIKLKYDHTFRVADLCEKIAGSLSLSDADRDLAWLAGMLHDIGRFEQVRRFGTFRDSESVDHAHFGVELLKDGLLETYLPEAAQDPETVGLLLKAIDLHSAFRLPEDCTERELLFCNILRDADKVDILRVNVEVPMEEIYNTTREVLMHDEVSPSVMEAFPKRSAVKHSLKHTTIDHLVGHISLVFELVYPYSLKQVCAQGYLDKMLAFRSENAQTNAQFAMICEEMRAYLAEKKIS
ncbi:MAG: HD domain-containing protein [Lachnospiraceae bacterium]|nr:HD domain-containing protein [Lachnospiraceae bacterium]